MQLINKAEAAQISACRERIAALSDEATVEQVIEAMAPLPANLFRVIDAEIGNGRHGYGGKGYLVRRLRNDPTDGPRMFEALAPETR